MQLNVPAFEAQSKIGVAIAEATEIDTFTPYVLDSATNTFRIREGGCAVVRGGVKCWGDNTYGQLGDETTTHSLTSTVTATENGVALTGVTDVSSNGVTTCVVANGALKCVGRAYWPGSILANSTQWVTFPGFEAGVVKVQVGASVHSQTPLICALTLIGTASCAAIDTGSPSGSTAATWTWINAGESNVKDISLPPWDGFSILCMAGAQTVCRTIASGAYGDRKIVGNGDNSEAVYLTTVGLCIYAESTVSCGSNGYANSQTTIANEVKPVAAMSRPLSVVYTNSNLSKIYFVLENGVLSADSWIFSCIGQCGQGTGQVVSPVSAFKDSTSTQFNFAESVTGATDNASFIPLRVVSGTRKSRSSVQIVVKTNSGEPLVETSVRWQAPDAPGLLGSSVSSTLKTADGGLARTTLTSGPVTFTLSGGSLASGATLQAGSITTVVPVSGPVEIRVSDAPAIVNRTISVTLPDGSPVPSATVNLANNFLNYAYVNSGSSTTAWSSRPRDTAGYMGQVACIYCFVAPPRYATGSSGTVTFPSFDLGIRSTSYDALVSYDDGELNQNVQKSFSSLAETVQMPFMARLATSIRDADPSTPTLELNSRTSGVDVETALVDEDGLPISDFESGVEVVCDDMENGGLISSIANVNSLCASISTFGSPSMGTVFGSGVSTMSAAKCKTTTQTKSSAAGKSTFKLCPTTSTRYRIRGKGALASQSFCVVVNGVSCTPKNSTVKKTAKTKTGKNISFASVNKVAKVAIPRGSKVALSVYKKSSKVCSVRGTRITALKPGTCSLRVAVTPKATKKVKKPKTRTTRVNVMVTGTPTVGVNKSITIASALKVSGSSLAGMSGVFGYVTPASSSKCGIMFDRIRGFRKGICRLVMNAGGKTAKLTIRVT